MQRHIRILAILNISFGVAVGTLFGLEIFHVIQTSLTPVQGAFQDLAGCMIALLAATFAVVVVPTMVLMVIGGIGLLSLRRWARTLTIATSALVLLAIAMGVATGIHLITPFPVLISGIAVPAYGLCVLLNRNAERHFLRQALLA